MRWIPKLIVIASIKVRHTVLCGLYFISTPSLLNSSPSEVLQKKPSSSNKSHIAKIENYIDRKFDQAAMNFLRYQVLTEIKNELDNNNTNIKKKWNPKSSEQQLPPLRKLRSHIHTLQNEVHFFREELKEKSVLL